MKKITILMTLIFVILSFAGCASPQAQPPGGNGVVTDDGLIGEERARELALAQVLGATENDIREFEMDRSDGRVEYEGEIYYDDMKYTFEIDGYSGEILNWEVESIYD